MSVSHSDTQTSWTRYRSQFSTDLNQTRYHGRVPEDVITYCFWWKSKMSISAKPKMELIVTIAFIENSFNVKYFKNGKR